MKKQTVVVTGANRGIGLEFCRQFKERGDEVIALCRRASSELKKLEVKIYEDLDVRSIESIKKCVGVFGSLSIDLLINNAGSFKNDKISALDFDNVCEQWEINALGPLKISSQFLPFLHSGSKIVMITSIMGSIEDNTSGAYYGYRSSKTALNMLSKSLSIDLKSQGITVLLFHPGYVITDMSNHRGEITPKESVSKMISLIQEKGIEYTGTFWHSNGEHLPW